MVKDEHGDEWRKRENESNDQWLYRLAVQADIAWDEEIRRERKERDRLRKENKEMRAKGQLSLFDE